MPGVSLGREKPINAIATLVPILDHYTTGLVVGRCAPSRKVQRTNRWRH